MANKKISQLTPKGSALVATDLLEVSVYNGTTYDTRSVTGANVVSGLQPTLVSGTNIKTINSTSLLGSGNIVISTGLTVGATAIASGTIGRILFEGTGNVLQQDSTLFWDNTNKRLGVGATPSSSVRLDVRAQGALSTDIAFRVRNSADSANLVTIQGDGSSAFGTYTNPNTRLTVTGTTFGAYISGNTGIYAQSNTTSGTIYAIDCLGRALNGANTSYGIRAQSDTGGVGSTNFAGRFNASNGTTNYAGYFDSTGGTTNYALYIQRGDMHFGVSPTLNKIGFWNATPIVQPTTAVAAATVVNGTGGTVKHDDTFDGYTLQQVVKALRNAGLLA